MPVKVIDIGPEAADIMMGSHPSSDSSLISPTSCPLRSFLYKFAEVYPFTKY